MVSHPEQLNEEEKQTILSRCLDLAVEGETYEYTTMYPEFAKQSSESKDHTGLFRTASKNFGPLTPIEQHHAQTYGVALAALQGMWICKVCSMIYDPAEGDPDSGIAAGRTFEAIPDDWYCPICSAPKASFVPYREAELKTS